MIVCDFCQQDTAKKPCVMQSQHNGQVAVCSDCVDLMCARCSVEVKGWVWVDKTREQPND